MEGRKTRNNFEVLQWNWTYQHEIVFFFSIYDIGRNKHKCVYTCMYVHMSVCLCVYICVYMCTYTHTYTHIYISLLSLEQIKSQNNSIAMTTPFAQPLISKSLAEVADHKTGVGKLQCEPGVSWVKLFEMLKESWVYVKRTQESACKDSH